MGRCIFCWVVAVVSLSLMFAFAFSAGATKSNLVLTLEFVADEADFTDDGTGVVTLLVLPDVGVDQARVEFTVEYGDAVVVGPGTVELGTLNDDGSYSAETTIQLTGSGKVSIRGTVIGVNASTHSLFRQSKALYIASSEGEVASGTVGYIPAELEVLKRRQAKGLISKSAYDGEEGRILRGGAVTQSSVDSQGSAEKGVAAITVSGKVLWTDQDGKTHAASGVLVEIHDASDGSADPIGMTNTEAFFGDGSYSTTVVGDPTGRDLFIRVKSISDLMAVRIVKGGDPQAMDSATMAGIASGAAVTIDVTANNTDDNNQAFSVHEAMHALIDYSNFFFGTLPRIQTVFPGVATSFNSSLLRIRLLKDDWPDWDVAHHEYGHYFQFENLLTTGPTGSHRLLENLAEKAGFTKDRGMELAWSEGHATYYGIAVQVEDVMSLLDIKGVGDTAYTDFLDGGGASNDLEINNHVSVGKGEDNELSVMRILWDLFDSTNDGRDEVSLGDIEVNRIIDENIVFTLSDLWNTLKTTKTVKDDLKFACIFADHKVAPEPTAPDDGKQFLASDPPPTFTWDANGAGPAFRLDKFTVEFYKEDFSTPPIFVSPEVSAPTYTPSMADWETILAGDIIVRWVVKGRNTTATETGIYMSCDRAISGVDVAFVIDDTGSMGEEIGGVRNALTTFITALAGDPNPPTINLITFKDNVTSRIVSNDLAAVQTEVTALFASGGSDCPEASVEALNLAAKNVKPGGRILFATDADAHDGLDIAGTIAALRAKAIRVDVLLSARCDFGGFKWTTGSCNDDLCLDAQQLKIKPDCTEPECFDPIPDPPPPVPTDAIIVFSTIAAETGGVFAFIPEVNSGDPTRFENVATNIMLGIISPTITDVNPPSVNQGTTLDIVLTGSNTNFNATSQLVVSGTGVTVNSVTVLSATSLQANVTVGDAADLSFRDLTVTTTLGKGATTEVAIGLGSLEVEGPVTFPTILAAFPSQGGQGETLDVEITGAATNFDDTSTADFGFGITVNSFTTLSATLGVANITIVEGDDSVLGFHNVSVTTTSSGEFADESIPGPFLVTSTALLAGVPRIVSVSPASGSPGTSATLTITGENTNFEDGVTLVSISGAGITVTSVTVVSATQLTAAITIDGAAAFGFRDVTVTTSGEIATSINGFEVGNAPPVADAGPDQSVTIAGATTSITLDGSASSDADGTIAAFSWTGTPDPGDVAMPSVTLGPGVHTFTLIVTDDQGAMSAPDTVTITVISTKTPGCGVVTTTGGSGSWATDLGLVLAIMAMIVFFGQRRTRQER